MATRARILADYVSSGVTAAEFDQLDTTGTAAGSGNFLRGDKTWQGAGKVIQVVNTQTGASATGSTAFPTDDTIPQNTEGDEVMTRAITPTNASNILKIDVVIHGALSVADRLMGAAIFQDSTAGALAAGHQASDINGANRHIQISFSHWMTAGTTSSTTFKVRAGAQSGVTMTFNGSDTGRFFGGVSSSSITIFEIIP